MGTGYALIVMQNPFICGIHYKFDIEAQQNIFLK